MLCQWRKSIKRRQWATAAAAAIEEAVNQQQQLDRHGGQEERGILDPTNNLTAAAPARQAAGQQRDQEQHQVSPSASTNNHAAKLDVMAGQTNAQQEEAEEQRASLVRIKHQANLNDTTAANVPAAKRQRREEMATANLDDLCNVLLVHVAGYIGPLSWCISLSDNGDETSQDHPQNKRTLVSINSARRLWGSFATLSKQWKQRVGVFLSPVLLLDADFYGVTSENVFPSLLWLVKNTISLGKLRLRTENYSTDFVAKIIRSCDIVRLEHVEVIVASTEKCPLLNEYFTGGFCHKDEEQQEEPMPLFDLHRIILRECTSIIKLKINCIARTPLRPASMSSAMYKSLHHKQMTADIAQLRCLRHVEFVLKTDQFSDKQEASCLLICFLCYAEMVEGLESLVLAAGHASTSKVIAIYSRSLKLIDVVNCGKEFWITKCVCPSLERFRCLASGMGNGVRTYNARTSIGLPRYREMHGSFFARSMSFYGMKVPGNCTIELIG